MIIAVRVGLELGAAKKMVIHNNYVHFKEFSRF